MARYYDANVGRFITRDRFHGFEDESQSLNQYTYCKNNHVSYVDPSGHIAAALAGGAATSAILSYAIYWLKARVGIRTWNWWNLTATVSSSAALGAVTSGLSGYSIGRFYKAVGLAEKLGMAKKEIKILKYWFSFKNLLMKKAITSFGRNSNESWSTAAKRFMNSYGIRW